MKTIKLYLIILISIDLSFFFLLWKINNSAINLSNNIDYRYIAYNIYDKYIDNVYILLQRESL